MIQSAQLFGHYPYRKLYNTVYKKTTFSLFDLFK